MTPSSREVLIGLLVSSYTDFKRRLAARLGSADLAAEALQDTYVRLSRANIQGEVRNPRSYLFRMALNIASNRARSEVRYLSASDVSLLIDLPDDLPDPLQTAEARSELAMVERALKDLTPRRREMFRQFWVENATYMEIAVNFNVSERTVRQELLLATRYLHDATAKFCGAGLHDRLSQVSSQ